MPRRPAEWVPGDDEIIAVTKRRIYDVLTQGSFREANAMATRLAGLWWGRRDEAPSDIEEIRSALDRLYTDARVPLKLVDDEETG